MLPASPSPRRFLPLIATAAKVLLVVLASGWILLALGWALLHTIIVPRIDDLRPQLQTLARQATGLQVEIGAIRARSTGVFPSFELEQVHLLDASGQPALQLPQVLIAISPRSLMTLEIEQLLIRGAELDIHRSADGRLWLAGVPISPEHGRSSALADWLLSQPEWALQGGSVHWRDDLKGVDLRWTEVDAVIRNPGQQHSFRIDATPPSAWGERLSLRGQFRQPLLSRSASDWRQWSGQLYGQFSRIDLAPLQAYAGQSGLSLMQGRGAMRTWLDLAQGRITDITADVALDDVQMRLAPQLAPLALARLSGRMVWHQPGGPDVDVHTDTLNLETADGLQWRSGKLSLLLGLDAQGQPQRGRLQADRLELGALANIAGRLPLGERWHRQIDALAPQGTVEQLEAQWQGPLAALTQLNARGKVSGLALAAATEDGARRPGVSGLNLDFKLQREAGQDKAQASFALNQGWLEFPGLFQEPRIALNKLSGELRFKRDAKGSELEWRQVALQGADAQGQFQGSWKRSTTGDAKGLLDLQGQLTRADGSRVWRYLPLGISEGVRNYVRQAVSQGQLSDVRFKVRGPLAAFPFENEADGDFQISGKLRNGSYAYVPPKLQEAGSKPWPALTQLDSELLFSRASLQILKAQARVAGQPGLQVSRAQARIDNLKQPVVEVSGQIKGPLAQALSLIQQSPLSSMTRQALARTTANGPADVQLKLTLPLQELARSRVQGSVSLAGNDVQFAPETPPMARLRGNVAFSETGFQISGAQTRMLGGELRFDGGMRAGDAEVVFRGQGTASVEALRQWRELAELAPLFKHASGSAPYNATMGLGAGGMDLAFTSPLTGIALALPEPLGKSMESSMPLRVEKTVLRDSLAPGRRPQDRLNVSLGAGTPQAFSVSYLRDISGAQPQVLAGMVQLGSEREASASGQEVRARIELPQLDLDAWSALLPTGEAGTGSMAGASSGYLPTAFDLKVATLRAQGRDFREVALSGRREAGAWKATLSANELSGQGEYRPAASGSPARLYARLSKLSLGPSAVGEMEDLLDKQPTHMPTLDIVIDELELRGKKLGRLEVEAVNRAQLGTPAVAVREAAREWRIQKLRLSVSEATLSATGSWGASASQRGTQLAFKLDVADSGELLKRLGLDGAIRRGKGRLEGQLGWNGSPLALHYPSMSGQMVVDMESGQFLKAEPGAAKLLGVLNLQALPRRLTLDFRDVFSDGFAFDWVRGNVAIAHGVASTRDLRMKGVNAAVVMDGSADIARETQDLRVLVVPELNAGTASLLAATVNPAMALGTFVAQWLLRQPLNQATSQEFHITGPWRDPLIQRVRQKSPPELRPLPENKP